MICTPSINDIIIRCRQETNQHESEQILNDRSDLPVNDNKISDQEELVTIDEVETEIILDISSENSALISTSMAMDHDGVGVYLS
ncbi:unnamed protein product [Rotaria magnacalcarata]|uniref:Uncharacterized protein n=2 Tax=Rotaria magnacalcarata TaxID=392030 RepID=A0A820HX27_9BILA|nr:unnamed protein product [Rotaria magnacalcarata]